MAARPITEIKRIWNQALFGVDDLASMAFDTAFDTALEKAGVDLPKPGEYGDAAQHYRSREYDRGDLKPYLPIYQSLFYQIPMTLLKLPEILLRSLYSGLKSLVGNIPVLGTILLTLFGIVANTLMVFFSPYRMFRKLILERVRASVFSKSHRKAQHLSFLTVVLVVSIAAITLGVLLVGGFLPALAPLAAIVMPFIAIMATVMPLLAAQVIVVTAIFAVSLTLLAYPIADCLYYLIKSGVEHGLGKKFGKEFVTLPMSLLLRPEKLLAKTMSSAQPAIDTCYQHGWKRISSYPPSAQKTAQELMGFIQSKSARSIDDLLLHVFSQGGAEVRVVDFSGNMSEGIKTGVMTYSVTNPSFGKQVFVEAVILNGKYIADKALTTVKPQNDNAVGGSVSSTYVSRGALSSPESSTNDANPGEPAKVDDPDALGNLSLPGKDFGS